jgi:hypothetical protein
LKREIVELDSIYQSFFGAPGWFVLPATTSYEYEWIAQGKKDALLKIVVRDLNGQQQIQSIEYQDVYLGLDAGLMEDELITKVYPNPSSNNITIQGSLIINEIQILELNGKTLKLISKVNSKEPIIDISELQQGTYFVVLKTNDGAKTIQISKN